MENENTEVGDVVETKETTVETKPTEAPKEEKQDDWRDNFDADKAAERIHKIQNENKNLRERAKDAEKKAATVDDLTKENADLKQKMLRMEVGQELGLPSQLIGRLRGETREEIIADARELVELTGGKAPAARRPLEQMKAGVTPAQEPEETDVAKIGARMFRR